MNDDDDNLPAETGETGPVARWVPAVVVLSAVVGFMSLAWYAYHAGTQSVGDDDLLVVEADKTPTKEKPADPGGMQFPNQDKTIFETFSGNAQNAPKVERVLPSPEEPIKPAEGTTTWVNQNIHANDAAPSKPEEVIGDDGKRIEMAPTVPKTADITPVEKSVAVDSSISSYTRPVPEPAKPAAVTPAPAPAMDAPVTVSEVPVATQPVHIEEPAPAVKPVKTVVAKAAAPKPAASKPAAAATGKARVQLGAYRSEKEAQGAWASLQKKYPDLVDKTLQIAKADLGSKGIYYRLRVTGFASTADAKKTCSHLSGKGQACILPTDN